MIFENADAIQYTTIHGGTKMDWGAAFIPLSGIKIRYSQEGFGVTNKSKISLLSTIGCRIAILLVFVFADTVVMAQSIIDKRDSASAVGIVYKVRYSNGEYGSSRGIATLTIRDQSISGQLTPLPGKFSAPVSILGDLYGSTMSLIISGEHNRRRNFVRKIIDDVEK